MRIHYVLRPPGFETERSLSGGAYGSGSQGVRLGRGVFRLWPVWLVLCVWTLSASAVPREVGLEVFVAPTGDDENPGTKVQPFATLGRAQKQVRALKRISSAAITVRIRGGTYYLPAPLVLTPEDSGTAGRPITYAAYGEEQVTLSGGRRLSGEWKPYRDGIWMCTVRAAGPGAIDFTQLFANGRRQIRARYPNGDSALPDPEQYAKLAGADAWPHHRLQFDPNTFTPRRWARPDEAVLHIFAANRWGNLQWQIGRAHV